MKFRWNWKWQKFRTKNSWVIYLFMLIVLVEFYDTIENCLPKTKTTTKINGKYSNHSMHGIFKRNNLPMGTRSSNTIEKKSFFLWVSFELCARGGSQRTQLRERQPNNTCCICVAKTKRNDITLIWLNVGFI